MQTIVGYLPPVLAALLLALGGFLALFLRAFRAGRAAQLNRDARARLAALREAQEIDRAINTTDPVRLRDELKGWGRK
jgi:hypothetical protein